MIRGAEQGIRLKPWKRKVLDAGAPETRGRLRLRMSETRRVLFCECAYARVLPTSTAERVRQTLAASGLAVESVPDLCALAAQHSSELGAWAGATDLVVAACHPRAVKWLFAAGQAPLPDAGVTYLDMRSSPVETLVAAVHELAGSTGASALVEAASDLPTASNVVVTSASPAEAPQPPAWLPWFPVIDETLCEDCKKCLNFCLFGVYAVDEAGTVSVKHPANCKTGCPACARVCPSAAIIFPKYANAPINGGQPKPGDPVNEPLKIDRAMLLSGDTLKILQDRGKRAQLLSRDSEQFKALQERLLHLAGGQAPLELGLPAEPTPAPASTSASGAGPAVPPEEQPS
jgi:Pyruvate/2-oxoacid:ferredoxin oxidoreductase delta subunit